MMNFSATYAPNGKLVVNTKYVVIFHKKNSFGRSSYVD